MGGSVATSGAGLPQPAVPRSAARKRTARAAGTDARLIADSCRSGRCGAGRAPEERAGSRPSGAGGTGAPGSAGRGPAEEPPPSLVWCWGEGADATGETTRPRLRFAQRWAAALCLGAGYSTDDTMVLAAIL